MTQTRVESVWVTGSVSACAHYMNSFSVSNGLLQGSRTHHYTTFTPRTPSVHTHTHTCTGHLSIWSVWLHALLWLSELFRDQPTEKSSNCHNFISCDQSTNKHSRGPPRLERPIVMFLTATSQGRGRTDICFFSTSGTPEEYGISDEGNTEGERAPTSHSAQLASF